MRRTLETILVFSIGLVLLQGSVGKSARPSAAPTLEDLVAGRLKIVDLGHSLNPKTPFWPGEQYYPFELKTIATLEKDGVLSKAFSCPEHLGTHLDAPNHFEANRPAVDQIAPGDLFAPGVVIDVSGKVAADDDYQLTREEVERWEKEHGTIPAGSIVFLRTGWGAYYERYARYMNRDVSGKLHFPGFSGPSAELLIDERKARGLGIDTLSIDRGISKDFAVHHITNRAGRYGLENVANLAKLPAKGFYVVVAPIKIETGTGGPTRIFAIVP